MADNSKYPMLSELADALGDCVSNVALIRQVTDGIVPPQKINTSDNAVIAWRSVLEYLHEHIHNRQERADKVWKLCLKATAHANTFTEDVERAYKHYCEFLAEIPRCPYPGLLEFDGENYRSFYGREFEIEKIFSKLRESSFLLLYGPSGIGKSSLLRAGICQQAKERAFHVITNRPIRIGEVSSLSEILEKWFLFSKPENGKYLLILDQFEELFSLHNIGNKSANKILLEEVQAIAKGEYPDVKLLLSIRADFIEKLSFYDLYPENDHDVILLRKLNVMQLRNAISCPAKDSNVVIEEGLLQQLVIDAKDEQGALPLLQETLRLMWHDIVEGKRTNFLRLEDYEALPSGDDEQNGKSGLAIAITRHANKVYYRKGMTDQQRKLICRIFLRLLEFVPGYGCVRRRVTESELYAENDDLALVKDMLNHLRDKRLVALHTPHDQTRKLAVLDILDQSNEEETVDIAHEVLIKDWELLAGWIKKYEHTERERRKWLAEVTKFAQNNVLLDAPNIKKAQIWVKDAKGQDLGGVRGIDKLIEQSIKALNPGWNKKGLVFIGLSTLSLIGLLSWVGFYMSSKLPIQILLIVLIVCLTAVVLIISNIFNSSAHFRFQKFSHYLLNNVFLRILLVVLFLVTASLWIADGKERADIWVECGKQNIQSTQSLTTPKQIVLVSDKTKFLVEEMASVLDNTQKIQITTTLNSFNKENKYNFVWTDSDTANKCRSFIDLSVNIIKMGDVADLVEARYVIKTQQLETIKDSAGFFDCGVSGEIAKKILKMLDGTEHSTENCNQESTYFNQEGMKHYHKEKNFDNYLEDKYELVLKISSRYFISSAVTSPLQSYPYPYNNLALVRMEQGKFDVARKNIDIAIRLSPDQTIFLFNKARICYEQNDFACTIENINKAIQKNEKKLLFLLFKAQVELEMDAIDNKKDFEKYRKVLEDIKKDIKKNSDEESYLIFLLGLIDYLEEKTDNALVNFRVSANNKNLKQESLLYILKIQLKGGDTKNACNSWRDLNGFPPLVINKSVLEWSKNVEIYKIKSCGSI